MCYHIVIQNQPKKFDNSHQAILTCLREVDVCKITTTGHVEHVFIPHDVICTIILL